MRTCTVVVAVLVLLAIPNFFVGNTFAATTYLDADFNDGDPFSGDGVIPMNDPVCQMLIPPQMCGG